jgi:hypothetical protein
MSHGFGALIYVPHAEPDQPGNDLGDREIKSVAFAQVARHRVGGAGPVRSHGKSQRRGGTGPLGIVQRALHDQHDHRAFGVAQLEKLDLLVDVSALHRMG